MQREVLTLASAGRFGSVTQCDHGCIHLQLGQVSITLTEPQYMRLVALVADSAANFEFFRGPLTESEWDPRPQEDDEPAQ